MASVIWVDAQIRMSASKMVAMPNCGLVLTSTQTSPTWYWMGFRRGRLARLKNGRSIVLARLRTWMLAKLAVKEIGLGVTGDGATFHLRSNAVEVERSRVVSSCSLMSRGSACTTLRGVATTIHRVAAIAIRRVLVDATVRFVVTATNRAVVMPPIALTTPPASNT